MLAGAVIIEQHDEWEAGDRRYFLRVVDALVENHERPDYRGRGGDTLLEPIAASASTIDLDR